MVSENIKDPEGRLKLTQSLTAFYHVLLCCVIIHIIPGYKHQIRILLCYLFHMLRKAIGTKGCPYVRIGKEYHLQCILSEILVRLQLINSPGHMMRQLPPCEKIYRGKYNHQNPGIIRSALRCLLFRHSSDPFYYPCQKVSEDPEEHQMNHNDNSVNAVKHEKGRRNKHRNEGKQ